MRGMTSIPSAYGVAAFIDTISTNYSFGPFAYNGWNDGWNNGHPLFCNKIYKQIIVVAGAVVVFELRF